MRTFLLVVLLPALAVGFGGAFALDRFARRIPRAWPRRAARGAAAVGGLVIAVLLLPLLAKNLSSGTWFCPVCGAIEDRTSAFGLTLATSATPDDEASTARSYSTWLDSVGSVEHDHSWFPAGCHYSWSRIACSFPVQNELLFQSLPLVPDPPRARELVVRLAKAPASERRELLNDFRRQEGTGELFERIARHEPFTAVEFDRAFPEWLDRHPAWR